MQRSGSGDEKAGEMGLKITGAYVTLGRYDMVFTCQSPDEETATRFLVAVLAKLCKTETMAAFPTEHFAKLVASA